MTEREEFEKWARETEEAGIQSLARDEEDSYAISEPHAAWRAWQASRSGLTSGLRELAGQLNRLDVMKSWDSGRVVDANRVQEIAEELLALIPEATKEPR
jgi:hypothetical protein